MSEETNCDGLTQTQQEYLNLMQERDQLQDQVSILATEINKANLRRDELIAERDELRNLLNEVMDDSLVTGMKSWKDRAFQALSQR